MKTARPVFGILAVATALLTLSRPAAAQVQAPQIDVGGNWDIGTSSGFTSSLSIPQFNPALGVLDSIQVDLGVAYQSTFTFSGPDGASGDFNAAGSITFQDPGNYIHETVDGAWNQFFSLPSFSILSGQDAEDILCSPFASPAILSEFTGDGDLNLQLTGSETLIGGGAAFSQNDATFDASCEVTYFYTVPEPGSFALLVAGFGIMLTRRTTRKLLNRNS